MKLTRSTRREAFDIRLAPHLAVVAVVSMPFLCGAAYFARTDETITARGRIEFAAWSAVTVPVEAQIAEVHCREGQAVRRGDVLFTLDGRELRAHRDALAARAEGLGLEREQAQLGRDRLPAQHQAELTVAERRLEALASEEALRARVASARAQLVSRHAAGEEEADVARLDHARSQELRRGQEAELAFLRARQLRDRAEADQKLAALDRAIREAATELTLAESQLADTTVRAPIDGVVLTPDPDRLRGRRAKAGESILQLADAAQHQFVMLVDERDVSRVRVGQTARIHLDSLPYYVYRGFDAKVTEVSVLPITEEGNQRTRFRVLLSIQAPSIALEVNGAAEEVALRPGLSGEGIVTINQGVSLRRYFLRKAERLLPTTTTVY